jgi:hypothetical protein
MRMKITQTSLLAVKVLRKTRDMGTIVDDWGPLVKRSTLPGRVSREVAAGAATITGDTFESGFYKEMRAAAAHWQSRVGTGLQLAVLVPAGLWGLGVGFAFPDHDISLLGIGSHRFFLFHSALPVWLLKKLYLAYLTDRVVPRPSRTG